MTKARAIGLTVIVLVLLVLYYVVWPAIHQSITRNYGGTITVTIPAGFEATGATWGEDNLWVFVRNPATGETMLIEDSRYGALQGKVIFSQKAN